tara:strand:+ start:213 stop:830 length:618 start_codon:yes stop_codon:yes gene_type:complete
MAIVGLSTIKEYLPEISGSTSADAELTALRDRVETAVARYLGYPVPDGSLNPVLDQATYSIYIDSPTSYDFYTLQLTISPIVSITSIHSDTNRQYLASSLIDSSTYTFNSQLGRVYLDPNIATQTFDTGYRANKVVIVAGYNSVTAPDDLEHAICVWVSQLHRNKASQGKEQITQAQSSIRVSPKSMPFEIKEFLNPLRVPGLTL